MRSRMNDILRVLFTPSCWIQCNLYSKQWDRLLLELMQCHKFKHVGSCYATLGPITLWIANHPCGSFRSKCFSARPKRATILKAYDRLMQDTFEEALLRKELEP